MLARKRRTAVAEHELQARRRDLDASTSDTIAACDAGAVTRSCALEMTPESYPAMTASLISGQSPRSSAVMMTALVFSTGKSRVGGDISPGPRWQVRPMMAGGEIRSALSGQ